PWGRPDLALFKFVSAILEDRPIDIYNHGNMYRDFTYIDDLVEAIRLLIDVPPKGTIPEGTIEHGVTDSHTESPVAPYRVINIGNSTKVKLLDFIDTIEEALDKKAIRKYLPMQMGDVPATWADTTELEQLTGFKVGTDIQNGISRFIDWYLEYYQVRVNV
ncbi:MAG: NAD-dependent epimerase/dehydratase family protein, partial [Balneolaceae bacterium]|nr:NAD-dependent epimerase/dehydratase family protein [Balneolaceae bacterium]